MQKGSLVSPEKLRFDFSHNKPITKDEMVKIIKTVNVTEIITVKNCT